MKPAFLTVDVQSDFLASPGLTPDAGQMVERIERALEQVRSMGWPVIHCRTRVAPDTADWMPHWKKRGKALCVQGTPGYEPPESLRPVSGEPVIHKRFYSAFENPELFEFLSSSNIRTLVIAGLHTHACVRSTVTDAYAKGFEVCVATDLVASYDPHHAQITLNWLDGRAARCLPFHSLVDELGMGKGNGPAV
jgi:nicotinamidase-related amidase